MLRIGEKMYLKRGWVAGARKVPIKALRTVRVKQLEEIIGPDQGWPGPDQRETSRAPKIRDERRRRRLQGSLTWPRSASSCRWPDRGKVHPQRNLRPRRPHRRHRLRW